MKLINARSKRAPIHGKIRNGFPLLLQHVRNQEFVNPLRYPNVASCQIQMPALRPILQTSTLSSSVSQQEQIHAGCSVYASSYI